MTRIANSRSSVAKARTEKRGMQPRKQATQTRSVATVETILRATARILVREGYDALSTNRVAKAAGVSVGSLYQYFPNKEALVAALLDRHMDETRSVLLAEAPKVLALPLASAVRRCVELMIAMHRVDPELHRVFVEQLPRIGDLRRIESTHDDAVALVRAYLAAHASEVRRCDADVAAFIVSVTIEAITHGAVLTRPELLDRPELVDETTELLVRYLKP